MNGLEGLPTKTLQLLWDNIHKEDGLITGEFTDDDGKHCAIGVITGVPAFEDCSNLVSRQKRLYMKWYNAQRDKGHKAISAAGISSNVQNDIENENDDFDGTDQERRVHMLQFLGSELMSRNDIEVEFRERIEAVA